MIPRHALIILASLACLLTGSIASGATRPPTAKPQLRFDGISHQGAVIALATPQDGSFIASLSLDRTIRLWTQDGSTLLRVLRPPLDSGNEGELIALAVSPDGRFVACAGWTGVQWDGTVSVYLFDSGDGTLLGRLRGLPNSVQKLAISPDGRWLAVVMHAQSGIRLYSIRPQPGSRLPEFLQTADIPPNFGTTGFAESTQFTDADFSPDSRLLATAAQDGGIRLYRLDTIRPDATPEPLRQSIIRQAFPPTAIRFSPDGSKLAIGFRSASFRLSGVQDRPVAIVETGNLDAIRTPDITGIAGSLSSVAWSKDGSTLYAGGAFAVRLRRHIRAWNLADGSHRDIPAGDGAIMALHPAPGNGLLAGALDGSLIRLDRRGSADLRLSEAIADFRYLPQFRLSRSGDTVQFSTDGLGFAPFCFSLTGRSLQPGLCAGNAAMQAPVQDWPGVTITSSGSNVSINGVPLPRRPNEEFYDGAFAPDGSSMVAGSNFALRRFGLDGSVIWEQPVSLAYHLAVTADKRLVVAALGDGTIRWYRLSDGSEVLALRSGRDGSRWIAWTPDGYFDASPNGEELIGYHLNQGTDREGRFLSLNSLYDVFFRPDILQAALRGEDTGSLITLTATEALASPPPVVVFTQQPTEGPGGTARACYRAISGGGGIGELRLYQNGKLIRSDGFYRETAQRGAPAPQLARIDGNALYRELRSLTARARQTQARTPPVSRGDMVSGCVDFEPVHGDNSIGVEAFNADNTVVSKRTVASFRSNRPPRPPVLHLLAIGIDRFADPSATLRFAARDAADFSARLAARAASLFGRERIRVRVLTDGRASRDGILQTVAQMAKEIGPEDTFVLFAASHGILTGQRYSLITSDFSGDAGKPGGSIVSHELIDLSKQIRALNQLFIFDTCHAGGIDTIVSGLYDGRMSVLARQMGLQIFASADSLQAALDGYKGNGLFTHTLLRGMDETGRGGIITAGELGVYARDLTTAISKTLGRNQTPLILSVGRDLPLIRKAVP